MRSDIETFYSLLHPFLCFTTNQFAQKLKKMVNLNTYFAIMCNIYKVKSKSVKWSMQPFPKESGGEN